MAASIEDTKKFRRMKNKGMQLGAMLVAILLLSMALLPTMNAEPLNKDPVTLESKSCNFGNANAYLNSKIVIDNKSQIKQQTPISVYELFGVEPNKLPLPLVSYKNAKIDAKDEMNSIVNNAGIQTNCKTCISKCSSSSATTGSDTGVGMADATAVWAANIAPATADFEINSWVSIDKIGMMDSGASEDSWGDTWFWMFWTTMI